MKLIRERMNETKLSKKGNLPLMFVKIEYLALFLLLYLVVGSNRIIGSPWVATIRMKRPQP